MMLSNKRLKYRESCHQQQYGCRNRIGFNRARKNTAFFIKPYIKTGELHPNNVDNIHITSSGYEPETFNGIVWTLSITNKDYHLPKFSFSRTARNCAAEINVISDNITIKDQIPLHWRRGNDPFPRDCRGTSLRGVRERREEYTDQLPFSYMGNFFYGNLHTTIPKGKRDELLFLFSFEEGNSVYIISSLNRGITQEHMEYLSLPFNIEYEIQIRFSSDKHDNLIEEIFKLNAISWDNVQLNKI